VSAPQGPRGAAHLPGGEPALLVRRRDASQLLREPPHSDGHARRAFAQARKDMDAPLQSVIARWSDYRSAF
jgi:hypothetical protein